MRHADERAWKKPNLAIPATAFRRPKVETTTSSNSEGKSDRSVKLVESKQRLSKLKKGHINQLKLALHTELCSPEVLRYPFLDFSGKLVHLAPQVVFFSTDL